MHSSAREANLKALLSDNSEVRSRVGDLADVYKAVLAEDVRGTRLAHMVDAVHLTEQEPDFTYDATRLRESNLPNDVLASFVHFLKEVDQGAMGFTDDRSDGTTSPKVITMNKFSFRGVEYSTASCRTRNSHILFRSPGSANPLDSGQITYIFFKSQVSTACSIAASGQPHHPPVYVCVRPYVTLQANPQFSGMDQMYRRFGFAGGFLCWREVAPQVVIKPSSIISHVAVTPLQIGEHQMLHILPMDRVRLYLSELHSERAYGWGISTISTCGHPSCTPRMLRQMSLRLIWTAEWSSCRRAYVVTAARPASLKSAVSGLVSTVSILRTLFGHHSRIISHVSSHTFGCSASCTVFFSTTISSFLSPPRSSFFRPSSLPLAVIRRVSPRRTNNNHLVAPSTPTPATSSVAP